MTWKDPIINEVRAAREKLLDEHGGYEGLVEYLKRKEKEHPEQMATKERSKTDHPQTEIR
jgi:hypothetical protein